VRIEAELQAQGQWVEYVIKFETLISYTSAMQIVSPTCGNITTMKNHAKNCGWFDEEYFGSFREDVLVRQAQIKDKENTDTPATPVSNILTPFAPLGLSSTAA
jgi:hypothetical protein